MPKLNAGNLRARGIDFVAKSWRTIFRSAMVHAELAKELVRMKPSDMKPHPLAMAIPEMLTDEYIELVADIKKHGVRFPVIMYEGFVLDGRHRVRACVDLGIADVATEEFTGTKEEAEALVLSANVYRRQLTFQQRLKLVQVELARDPAQSDRSIADKTDVSEHTVAKVRTNSNARGAHTTERKEASGRKARGRKPQDRNQVKTPPNDDAGTTATQQKTPAPEPFSTSSARRDKALARKWDEFVKSLPEREKDKVNGLYLAFATAFGGETFRLVGSLAIILLGLALVAGGLADRLSRKGSG